MTGKPLTEVAKRIIKRSSYEGLTGSDKRLCIYFRPSRRGRNQIISEEVLQVDCHVPAAQDFIAYRVIQRVKELLHEKSVGSQAPYYDGHLGELPTMSGFFCAGIRFNYYTPI
jgi:hypothetical protein